MLPSFLFAHPTNETKAKHKKGENKGKRVQVQQMKPRPNYKK